MKIQWKIDAKVIIGSKIAFWKHLGRLGSHLGAQKVGRGIPSCEKRAEPTLPGRGRGGVNPSLEGTGREKGSGARDLHALRPRASAD